MLSTIINPEYNFLIIYKPLKTIKPTTIIEPSFVPTIIALVSNSVFDSVFDPVSYPVSDSVSDPVSDPKKKKKKRKRKEKEKEDHVPSRQRHQSHQNLHSFGRWCLKTIQRSHPTNNNWTNSWTRQSTEQDQRKCCKYSKSRLYWRSIWNCYLYHQLMRMTLIQTWPDQSRKIGSSQAARQTNNTKAVAENPPRASDTSIVIYTVATKNDINPYPKLLN